MSGGLGEIDTGPSNVPLGHFGLHARGACCPVISKPRVSVTAKRLRRITFLPASCPRVARPTVSAALTLWESMMPALGSEDAQLIYATRCCL